MEEGGYRRRDASESAVIEVLVNVLLDVAPSAVS